MRRFFSVAALLALGLYFGFQEFFGAYLFSYNTLASTNEHVLLQDQFSAGSEAKKIHGRLQILDMHADTTLWDVDLLVENDTGHVDLPRLQKGNVALQVFSAVTKISYELLLGDRENVGELGDPVTTIIRGANWPKETYDNYLARSLYHAEKLRGFADRSEGHLRLITRRSELLSLIDDRSKGIVTIGALLSLEGIYSEGGVDDFESLFEAGFRMASLTHFLDNQLGGASNGEQKGGLTPEGRQMIALMQHRGMVVDVAHVSSSMLSDIVKITRYPIVRSHGGVTGATGCGGNRNLDDDQIIAIANTGGVIGIGFWPEVICGSQPSNIAETISYVVELLDRSSSFKGDSGLEHVGLGSDFDGLVTTPFDAAHLDQLTQALLDTGFDENAIRKIAGGNVLRVLLNTLPE